MRRPTAVPESDADADSVNPGPLGRLGEERLRVAGSSAFTFNVRLKPGFRLISASPKSPLIRMRHDDDIYCFGQADGG